MRKSSIASVLAITVLAASLAGCEEPMMAGDPNRFDLNCEGEVQINLFHNTPGEYGRDITGDPLTIAHYLFSVDLEKNVFCMRQSDWPHECFFIEEIPHIDRRRMVLYRGLMLNRETGELRVDTTHYDFNADDIRHKKNIDPDYKLKDGDQVTLYLDGTIPCKRRAFRNMEDNRKF